MTFIEKLRQIKKTKDVQIAYTHTKVLLPHNKKIEYGVINYGNIYRYIF